jgi:hypothetical protein
MRSTTLLFAAAMLVGLRAAAAQRATPSSMGSMAMPDMGALPLGVPMSRLGPGTSWLPDSTRERAARLEVRNWDVMLSGSAFGHYDRQAGLHGGTQWGDVDWEMAMAMRPLARGVARVELMTSFEALVDGPRGYPELLETGGAYRGARIVDHQHPNDLLMALGGAYDRPLTSNLAWSVYGAAVGEPALGPVHYEHRPSAADDPFAPIGHHWQDATHQAFGVVTAGLYTHAVKLEGSAFNAREPDAYHFNLDYGGARLDSYAGRVTVNPVGAVSLSAWGGYLFDHDPLERGLGMQRYGASVLTSTAGVDGGSWSNAIIWGLNIHHHGDREHVHDPNAPVPTHHLGASGLIESTLELGRRDAVFVRLEQVQKNGDDLGFLGDNLTQLFTIREIAGGATHELAAMRGVSLDAGARASVELLPATLELTYRTRHPAGVDVYLRLRPARGPR